MQDIRQDFKNIPLGQRIPAFGYAVKSKDSKFEKFSFTRHPMGEKDIVIEILFAGICHSDIHSARSEWHRFTLWFPDTRLQEGLLL